MQLVRRPLAPNELDHELVWLLVSVGATSFGLIWFSLGLPWPVCIFHLLTGHACPTCGATRSASAFIHGQLLAAWSWNPLALTGLCALFLFNLYAMSAVVSGAFRLRLINLTRSEKRWMRVLPVALLTCNWVYLLLVNR